MVPHGLTLHALDDDLFNYRCVHPGNIPALLVDDRDPDYTTVMPCDYDRPGALSLFVGSFPKTMITTTNDVWPYDIKFWSFMVVRKFVSENVGPLASLLWLQHR